MTATEWESLALYAFGEVWPEVWLYARLAALVVAVVLVLCAVAAFYSRSQVGAR